MIENKYRKFTFYRMTSAEASFLKKECCTCSYDTCFLRYFIYFGFRRYLLFFLTNRRTANCDVKRFVKTIYIIYFSENQFYLLYRLEYFENLLSDLLVSISLIKYKLGKLGCHVDLSNNRLRGFS